MKVLSTDGLTELIQLTKDNFISNSNTVQATVGTLATVATSGSYNDLSNKPTIPTVNNAILTIQKNGTTVNTFTANASSDVTANITVPTDTSDLTNNAGFITGITSSDVTTALGYTPYNSTNPNGYITSSALSGYATETWVGQQGYLTSVPTATASSLGAVQPDGVTITIDANGVISGASSVDIDNTTITENSSDELQTVAVIDDRSGSAIKTWTGTRQQYDAIVNKDATTLYNITDDTDVTLSLLELLYPVGSIYIGTMAICPLATLGVGTWQLVASDRVLQGAGTRGSVGNTVNESLPNIKTRTWDAYGYGTKTDGTSIGITIGDVNNSTGTNGGSGGHYCTYKLDASSANSTYQDNAPVQQDAYLVNIWERTA